MFCVDTGVWAANKAKRELIKSGAVGYEEKTAYVWDESKEIVYADMGTETARYCRVTDKAIPIESLVGAELVYTADGHKVVESFAQENANEALPGYIIYMSGVGTPMFFMFVSQEAVDSYNEAVAGSGAPSMPGIGLYLFEVSSGGSIIRTESISKTTIHPIDPKYLPEGVVIDLDQYGINLTNLVMSGGGSTTIKNSALVEMWETINKNRDVVFTGAFGDISITMHPCAMTKNGRGTIGSFCLQLGTYYNGSFLSVMVQFTATFSGDTDIYLDETHVHAVVNMTALATGV